jgi:hypothetical protein
MLTKLYIRCIDLLVEFLVPLIVAWCMVFLLRCNFRDIYIKMYAWKLEDTSEDNLLTLAFLIYTFFEFIFVTY